MLICCLEAGVSFNTSSGLAKKIFPLQNAMRVRKKRTAQEMQMKTTMTVCHMMNPGRSKISVKIQMMEMKPTFGNLVNPDYKSFQCQ